MSFFKKYKKNLCVKIPTTGKEISFPVRTSWKKKDRSSRKRKKRIEKTKGKTEQREERCSEMAKSILSIGYMRYGADSAEEK